MLSCMFDNCASTSLITRSAAAELNLTGQPDILEITTVTSKESIKSYSYSLPLFDLSNKRHLITVHGIESIANNPQNDVSGVKCLFSANIQTKWDSISQRPVGEIDVLLSTNVLSMHPCDLEC